MFIIELGVEGTTGHKHFSGENMSAITSCLMFRWKCFFADNTSSELSSIDCQNLHHHSPDPFQIVHLVNLIDDLDKLDEIQRGQTNCFATHNLDLDGLPVCLLIRFVIGICLVLFVKSDVEKQIDTIWISVLLVIIYFSPYCWWSSDKQELFI